MTARNGRGGFQTRPHGATAILRGARTTALLLLAVDGLDELASGLPGASSPEIQRAFDVSPGMAAGWLLTAMTAGVVLEPPLFMLSDRFPRRWFVCGGLAGLGIVTAAAGLAPSYWTLFAALVLYGPLSGCGVSLSQATLIDLHPERPERVMARWTLLGALGDLAAPLALTLAVVLGGSWRTAFVVMGAVLVLWSAVLWRRPFPDDARRLREDGPRESLRESLSVALSSRPLLLWAAGLVLCSLLDETLVAFGALHLRDGLGLDLPARNAVITAGIAGSIVGLLATERLATRVPALTLLLVSTALSAVTYAAWLFSTSALASAALLFAACLFTSAHYPLAKAQAYRCLPGRSGAVAAVTTAFGVVTLALPALLGVTADRFGVIAALALLGAQPVLLFALAVGVRMTRER